MEGNIRSSTPNSIITSSKPCRYGDSCSRPGCRFRHSFDNVTVPPVPQAPVNNLYCSNNWLPHNIKMTLAGSKLEIKKVAGEVSYGTTLLMKFLILLF